MEIVQTYIRRSTSDIKDKAVHFNISPELSRKEGVLLDARIHHSLDYARFMLALNDVATGDWRSKKRDVPKHKKWANGQYKIELPQYFGYNILERAAIYDEIESINSKINDINTEINPLIEKRNAVRLDYEQYVSQKNGKVLDPIISVHRDGIIFEAFSVDESSYARLEVPKENLEIFGDMICGTMNIDFNSELAMGFKRVRNYRPAWIKIEKEADVSKELGTFVEKKTDLPESWIRNFLQMQSAALIPGTGVVLSAETLSTILSYLTRNKEKESPRSLRFILKKGKKPKIVIDPWSFEVEENNNIYNGSLEGEIRIWGRKRLMVLKDLLPYSDTISVWLAGTGMPSLWSLNISGHRFDLGLTGRTAGNWTIKGNYDLLNVLDPVEEVDNEKLIDHLRTILTTTIAKTAKKLKITNKAASLGLQMLCKKGQAMYDHVNDCYRWRQLIDESYLEKKDTGEKIPVNTLFQPGIDGKPRDIFDQNDMDKRFKYASALLQDGKVKLVKTSHTEKLKVYSNEIIDLLTFAEKEWFNREITFKTRLEIDLDGSISRSNCNCSFFRLNKLRKGPCNHIMASILMIQGAEKEI